MRRSEFKTLVTIGIIGAIVAASIYGGYIDFTPSTVSAGDDSDDTNTTTTVTIENPYSLPDGMSIDSASYIIFQNGTLTCAKNGETGYTEYYGANASSVINTVLTTSSGTIYFSPGTYHLTASLLVYDDTRLVGYGATLAADTDDVDIIRIEGSCNIDATGQEATPIYGTNIIFTSTTGLDVGDTIYLRSDDLYVPWYTYAFLGSQHIISRIINATSVEVLDTIYLDYRTNTRLITTDLRSNISIEGITLRGTGAYDDAPGNTGISTLFASGITIKDVMVIDCARSGFDLLDTIDVEIDDTSVSGSHRLGYGYGVNVGNSAKNIEISGSTFENCRHGSSNGGNTAGIPAYVTYSQCIFRNTEAERQHSNGLAIGFDSCTFDNVGEIQIECSDSYISNSFIQGIRYAAPGDPTYNTVVSSVDIISVGHTQAFPENVKIVNNHIKYSFEGISGTELNAITLSMAPNCIVSGNTVNFTGIATLTSSAIKVYPVVAFNGVTISDNSFIQETAYGIRGVEDKALSNIVVSGNTFLSSSQFAIYFPHTFSNVTITNNHLESASRGGVMMVGVQSAVIAGNIIISEATINYAGIYLYQDCSSITVASNHISCPYTGIYVQGAAGTIASKVTITGNTVISKVGIRCIYSNNITIGQNSITVIENAVGIKLDSNDFDIIVNGNTIIGPYTTYVLSHTSCHRIAINGVGANGAYNPNASGEWYGFGYEGLIVEWTNGTTHYMSVYRNGTWYSWTVS